MKKCPFTMFGKPCGDFGRVCGGNVTTSQHKTFKKETVIVMSDPQKDVNHKHSKCTFIG